MKRDNKLKVAAKTAPTPVKVDITGTRNNKYLFSMRKAVREFLADDAKGYLNAIHRFNSKIEAARLLFPEDRVRLHECLTLLKSA